MVKTKNYKEQVATPCGELIKKHTVGVRSIVVERATHMRVYAGSIPTGADHRKEFILALSFSPNDVK